MDIRKWYNKYSIDCDIYYESESTRKTYRYCVNTFLKHFKNEREPKNLKNEDIKKWLLSFKTINTRKQMLCGINSFYKLTVGMPKKIKSIPYPKKQKSLPKIIDSVFLENSINNINNLKHRSILSLGYGCALRVSEVVNLKIQDIDSKRMLIHIRNSKGGKDRYVKLSDNMLLLLRRYYKKFKPTSYLFNGQQSFKYTASSCNKLVKNYLGDQYHFHLLRHSGLTVMHENGVDIATLSKIAGHNSIKTTMIYTHISNNAIKNCFSPI